MATTFLKVRESAQKILGDYSGDTKRSIDRWINDARNELWEIVPGTYKDKTDYLTTVVKYSTGTVDVTNGSAVVTGTGTVWTSAMATRFFKAESDAWYRILTIDSNTQLTLEDEYVSTTDTGADYQIHTFLNTMASDVLRLHQVSVQSEENWTPLDILDREDFYSSVPVPLRWDQGIAEVAWIDEETSGGLQQMGIYPPTADARLVQYRYEKEPTELSSDSDTMEIPAGEHAILYQTLVRAFTWRDKINLAAFYEQKYEKALDRLLGSTRRSRHMTHRRRDQTDAQGVKRYVNLGANFPRRG